MNIHSSIRWFSATAIAWLVCATTSLSAAPPTLNHFYPTGVAAGQTVNIEAPGKAEPWPPHVWASQPGVTVTPDKKKGRLNITAAANVPPGVYWLRLYSDEGASPQRPFVVGTLPEINEVEPNNDFRKPQVLDSSSVVLNGKFLGGGDVDTYAVKLAAKQTIVATMLANEVIASPMDTVMEVVSADGFRISYNHDTFNLDPQIVFTAPVAGTYLIRTFAFPSKPNSSIKFSAAASYIYRLTLTTGAFLDHTYPLAVSSDSPRNVELRGWNIPETARFFGIQSPRDNVEHFILSHPRFANNPRVKVVPHPVTVESASNSREQPQEITLPMTASGSISQPGDEDWYRFTASKGQKIEFRIDSWSLGYPLDPLLRLTDAAGKRLAQADDMGGGRRDAVITHTFPADGEYRLMVRDLHRHGGFRYVYRVSATFPRADYALKIGADSFTLTPGKPLEIPVTVERQNGFGGEIDITAVHLPAGVTATTLKSLAKGETAKSVKLQLTATAGLVSGTFQVVGQSGAKEATVARTADAPIGGFTARTETPWLTVIKPAAPKK